MHPGSLSRAVVVMGKRPHPGRVKTRLVPPLSFDQAAQLYAAFLRDVFALVERAVGAEARRVFVCALGAGESLEEARALAPPGWGVLAQVGDDLGARIAHARAAGGAADVVVIGSDAPAMEPQRIRAAFDRLEEGRRAGLRRVVIGPTADGGYDLIASSQPEPALLAGIPWSTPEVLAATRRAAATAGISLLELELGWDVDVGADLERLARCAGAPEARRYLMGLGR